MQGKGDNSSRPEVTFRTGMPVRYRVILLVLGVIATIGTGAGLALVNIGVAVISAVLFLAVFISVSFMRTTVQLDAREISIKVAGIFGTKIPYKSIDDVAPAEPTGLTAGMGLRVLQNRTTGYLVGGPSVRITLARTAVLVSSDTPEKLSEAIEVRRADNTSSR